MELAEKKCDSVFVVKGNWLKRKCDQVKEEFKTIEQDILALEDNKKRFLEKQILKAALFILFLSCSVSNLVLFSLPFSKSFGLLICLCFVASKFVSVLLRSRAISVMNHCILIVTFVELIWKSVFFVFIIFLNFHMFKYLATWT